MIKTFFIHTVTTIYIFKKEVLKMVRQKGAKLFHCYVEGDIIKIAIAEKVQQFDFRNLKSEKQICKYIDKAIQILHKHLPEQLILFSETKIKRNSASGK